MEGGVRFRGALPGVDVEVGGITGGVEDWLVFASAPARETVTYDVDLHQVAGLRLVEGVLELLDAGGAPRLRVRRPVVVGADGVSHAAALTVPDCAVDRDPAPPWDRPVTAPGSDRCSLVVSWGEAVGDPVPYPARVDPAWTESTVLVTPRHSHAAALLQDGRVLVAGGYTALGSTTYITDAEVYDPVTRTWAVTGSMTRGRAKTLAFTLSSGRVLVPAGDDGLLPTADLYDPGTGTFRATGAMRSGRDDPGSALLPDGRVLVFGGCTAYSFTCTALSDDAEVYDPGTDTWTSVATAMSDPRQDATATLLPDGRVVVAGGCRMPGAAFSCFTTATSVDVFDATTDAFVPVASLPTGLQGHSAAPLPSGELLVVGGTSNGVVVRDAFTWDPLADTWTAVPSAPRDHNITEAAVLPSGSVFVAGSWGSSASFDAILANVDRFDPTTGTWRGERSMARARGAGTTTRLADGRILVAGGFDGDAAGIVGVNPTAEVFDEDCDDPDDDQVCAPEDVCDGDDRLDDDSDGLPDACDGCPAHPDPGQEDADGDGFGDACDDCPDPSDPDDLDRDGFCDGVDLCLGFPDLDDDDFDAIPDGCDSCPTDFDDGTDQDGDGLADACDPCPSPLDPIDSDADGSCDGADLCPGADDAEDLDADGAPDACDPCPDDAGDDSDDDGVCDSDDQCAGADDDGPDADADGFPDACDTCPDVGDDQLDTDGDGSGDACDCRPDDAAIHPGAAEVCNFEDDDCDGSVNTGAVDAVSGFEDFDGDGFGSGEETVSCPGPGFTTEDGDCDDTFAGVSPGATETCNGRDDDCDGEVDPGCDDASDEEGGCGCDQPASGPVVAPLVVALLALRRRRRS
jgi:N-acetylneuraminic acid mutarotase